MKIQHWIDKYDHIISEKIIKKYNTGLTAGRSTAYGLHFSFWAKYVIRLLLALAAWIFVKKNIRRDSYQPAHYSPFYSPDQHSPAYIKFRESLAALFGFRYFLSNDILPLAGTDKILRSGGIHLPETETPVVSIIIPVYNQLEYTYNCLKSIQNNVSTTYPFEVIVVNNGSTDQTNTFFTTKTQGITYINTDKNQGFVHARQLGVSQAKGKFICFLNNDVQVSKNWLEALVISMEDPQVGCAGSKLLFPVGLLKEAGGIFSQDHPVSAYGENSNPEHPFYNYAREADYCSGISLIFRKADFGLIEPVEEQETVSFYNNINNCFAVRHQLKKKVIYQPLSSLIHFGSVNHLPIKDSVPANRFSARWQKELSWYKHSGNADTDARRYQTGKTMLFIDDSLPAPDQDSGSSRLFGILKIVRSLGYHVVFLPNDGDKRGAYFNQMVFEGFEVLYRYPNRKGMLKVLLNRLPDIDTAWICKPDNNERFRFIFDIKQDLKWIYDTIDLHFLRLRREGELTQNLSVIKSAEEIKAIELSIAKKADLTIAITSDELKILKDEQINNVAVIPNIHESKVQTSTSAEFRNRSGLLFIGGYLHPPNVDAAEWLVKEIMPEVWKINPSVRLTLLGSNPTKDILAYQSDKISIPGYIHDVSLYFNTNRVFIAPLRFGAGMKGKIGQSLEYGLPIVSTDIGVEGMGLISEENVLVANDTAEFTEKIIRLYESPVLWEKLRKNSASAIENYSPQKVTQIIKALLDTLA